MKKWIESSGGGDVYILPKSVDWSDLIVGSMEEQTSSADDYFEIHQAIKQNKKLLIPVFDEESTSLYYEVIGYYFDDSSITLYAMIELAYIMINVVYIGNSVNPYTSFGVQGYSFNEIEPFSLSSKLTQLKQKQMSQNHVIEHNGGGYFLLDNLLVSVSPKKGGPHEEVGGSSESICTDKDCKGLLRFFGAWSLSDNGGNEKSAKGIWRCCNWTPIICYTKPLGRRIDHIYYFCREHDMFKRRSLSCMGSLSRRIPIRLAPRKEAVAA